MRFTATPIAGGTPYPEVTESICLVPEQTITRAPENTLLVHLCRFVVRIPTFSLADFPGRRPGGFPLPNLTSLWMETIITRAYVLRPRIGLDRTFVVTEC